MTAPLPPPTWPSVAKGHTGLPVAAEWQATLAREGFPWGKTRAMWDEAAVKLAVREALELAAVECEATLVREGFHSAFRCAANVRAMIEEYK